jgi:hypothetical protein
MRSQSPSPLALVSRALVTERLDLVEGAGEGIDDAVYIRIAGALVRRPRTPRRLRGLSRVFTDKTPPELGP